MKKKHLWFKSKTYGWGWVPATWQGFLITAIFVVYELVLVVFIGNSLEEQAGVGSFLFLTLLGAFVLVAVCYEYGEEPEWQWGGKKLHPKRSR